MVAFVIFWSAFLAIIFFLLGSFFKILTSVFEGVLNAIKGAVGLIAFSGLVIAALYMVYGITEGIINDGIGSVIGMFFLFLIELGLVVALVGGLGSTLLEIVGALLDLAIELISIAFEAAASFCESKFYYFLQVIQKRLSKC